jgi:hypothetical protein
MPQRASVFCNFYIRVDREALVSERALNVGSVAFKAMSTKKYFFVKPFTDKFEKLFQNLIDEGTTRDEVLKICCWAKC